MPRLAAALAFALLLALPVGLVPALVDDALLRVGVWLDGASRGRVPDASSARADIESADPADPGTARLDAWRAAADAALLRPVAVALPHRETVASGASGSPADDLAAGAVAFEVVVRPPDVLRVATRAASGAVGGLVVDVLDPGRADATGRAAAIASLGPADLDVRVPVAADAAGVVGAVGTIGARAGSAADPLGPITLLVRVQPTPGAIGRFSAVLESRPTLDFPVATDARDPIRSFFGMPRDGGRREHHGIDVFAPRGTPVLAAADGVVARTGDSARGGLHVWQRARGDDGRVLGTLYYAHLDRVDVAVGDVVARGTRLGTVGNTGNARTTPPHLHFGLYRRFSGPADPLPLTGPRRVPAAEPVPGPALARWLAVLPARANVRSGPGTDHATIGAVAAGELVRADALAGDGRWVRVTTGTVTTGTPPGESIAGSDGGTTSGWIARSLLGAPRPAPAELAAPFELRASHDGGAAGLATVENAEEVRALGRFGSSVRVRTADGLEGWALDAAAP